MKNTPAILLALSIFILFLLIQQTSTFSLDNVFSGVGTIGNFFGGAKDTIGEVAGWSGQKIRIIPELLAQEEYEEEYYESEEWNKTKEEWENANQEEYYESEEWNKTKEEWENANQIYDDFVNEEEEWKEEEEEVVVECYKDTDCEGDAVCVEERCAFLEVECETDDECEGDAVCVEGRCAFLEVECETDEDCEEGTVCNVEGRCAWKEAESALDRLLKSVGIDVSKIPGTKGKSSKELLGMPAVKKALADKGVPSTVLDNMKSTLEKVGKPTGGKIGITNPLSYTTFDQLIKAIIVFLRNLALVATALVIVLAGFYFVTSVGDPAKVTKAKQMILYALIGLAIVLAAEGIVALMGKVIKGK